MEISIEIFRGASPEKIDAIVMDLFQKYEEITIIELDCTYGYYIESIEALKEDIAAFMAKTSINSVGRYSVGQVIVIILLVISIIGLIASLVILSMGYTKYGIISLIQSILYCGFLCYILKLGETIKHHEKRITELEQSSKK